MQLQRNKRDSEIFTWYVGDKLSELKDMAREMDERYFKGGMVSTSNKK